MTDPSTDTPASILHYPCGDGSLNSKIRFFRCTSIKFLCSGTIRMPPLSNFTVMRPSNISTMPRINTSDSDFSHEGYVGPVTRSARRRAISQAQENLDSVYQQKRKPRSQSQKPMRPRNPSRSRPISQKESINTDASLNLNLSNVGDTSHAPMRGETQIPISQKQIPFNFQWKDFISRHEIPRKLLHVSIGIFSIYFYTAGIQTTSITPLLLSALVPITATDYLRLNYDPLNKIYIRVLGPLMRESEYRSLNGVIWYLIGAWFVLTAFPKDIGLMGILLLSWCDTAASTVGRAFGRYTPSLRKGKSLAGSAAAFAVGVSTAAAFWGWLAPSLGPFPGDNEFPFMFTGTIRLPELVRNSLGLTENQNSVSGWIALSIMSIWTGFVASASEAVALFGLDDNLTIPVLSGIDEFFSDLTFYTLQGRYISPVQAVWRLLGYATHEEKPAVMLLPYHLEGQHRVSFDQELDEVQLIAAIQSQTSIFLDWMKYNSQHTDRRDQFYSDFPLFYTHVKNRGWHPRKKGLTIGRMLVAVPRQGEHYYLRTLLTVKTGAKSYRDLYAVDGIVYDSPSAACRALGLIFDDSDWISLFNEVKDTSTAASLRKTFAS
ncbi:hypothetical protein EPUL_005133, partial [Erysiphe pulchra]